MEFIVLFCNIVSSMDWNPWLLFISLTQQISELVVTTVFLFPLPFSGLVQTLHGKGEIAFENIAPSPAPIYNLSVLTLQVILRLWGMWTWTFLKRKLDNLIINMFESRQSGKHWGPEWEKNTFCKKKDKV